MTDPIIPAVPGVVPPPPPSWKDWWPAISVIIVLIGAMLTGGGYIAQVRDNTRRIERLESKVDALSAMDGRMARIEGKLDLLMTLREGEQPPRERRP